jgi:hypothetical protein
MEKNGSKMMSIIVWALGNSFIFVFMFYLCYHHPMQRKMHASPQHDPAPDLTTPGGQPSTPHHHCERLLTGWMGGSLVVRATLRSGPEGLILARETQKEYSKVPFARPGTMYQKGCDYLQWSSPNGAVVSRVNIQVDRWSPGWWGSFRNDAHMSE